MSMRKKSIVVQIIMVLIIVSTLLAGCSKDNQNKGTVATDSVVTTSSIKVSDEEKKIDLDNYKLDYKEGEDHQPFFFWSEITKSETGYYFWGKGTYDHMLMFFDRKSGMTVPLCNLPNCKHTKEDYDKCNGYFNEFESSPVTAGYDTRCLQYYNGNIYIIGVDSDAYVCMFRVAKDGSTREKSCRLFKFEPETDSDGGVESYNASVGIHRGYLYFINNKEKELKLRRVKLDSKEEAEVIYKTEGIRPNLYRMEGYGDYIFFQGGNFTDEACENMDGGIYAYNIVSQEISLVKKDAISAYMIKDTDIYYSTEDAVKKYNLLTQKDEIFVKTKKGYAAVAADNNYIYVAGDQFFGGDEDSTIHVYKPDKTEVGQIQPPEGSGQCYFGDDSFLFAETFGSSSGLCIEVFDKSKFNEEESSWKKLY